MEKVLKFRLENKFGDYVLKELNKLGYFFKKEAGSIRGLPDIIGTIHGSFVALELKKSTSEAGKNRGRIVLQKHTLEKLRREGAFAELATPDNFHELLEEIRIHCKLKSKC